MTKEQIEKKAKHYLLYEHKSPLNEILHLCDLKTEMQYHRDIENAYMAGATSALQNLWISVEDELPPFDEVVIVHCDDVLNPNDMMLTHRTNDDEIITDENNFCTYNEEIITYWMPIPKLNKK